MPHTWLPSCAGSGKTVLARAAAAAAGARLFVINGPDVVSEYFGESEAGLRGVFAAARALAPSVSALAGHGNVRMRYVYMYICIYTCSIISLGAGGAHSIWGCLRLALHAKARVHPVVRCVLARQSEGHGQGWSRRWTMKSHTFSRGALRTRPGVEQDMGWLMSMLLALLAYEVHGSAETAVFIRD